MNTLVLGTNKQTILDLLPKTFLLIDDGSLIDQYTPPPHRRVTSLDFSKHTINPLKDMDYYHARELISVFNAAFPEGENTLTRKNSNYVLLKALLNSPKRLSALIGPNKADPAITDAYQKIQTLLLSPVLKRVLDAPTNVSLKGIVTAKLDRGVLGEFDAFVLGNILMMLYKGAVVVSDFGFYAHTGHRNLIRQGRLTAGVNALDELPTFQSLLLTIDAKVGSHCTSDDAEVLALYAGLQRGTVAFSDFVGRAIS